MQADRHIGHFLREIVGGVGLATKTLADGLDEFGAFLHADDALHLLAVFFNAFTPHRMLLIVVQRFASFMFVSSFYLVVSVPYSSNETASLTWLFMIAMGTGLPGREDTMPEPSV